MELARAICDDAAKLAEVLSAISRIRQVRTRLDGGGEQVLDLDASAADEGRGA